MLDMLISGLFVFFGVLLAELIYTRIYRDKILAKARDQLIQELTDLIGNNEEITMTIVKNHATPKD